MKSMKCFEVVQNVLSETYAQIPGKERDRDKAISEALESMSDQYRNKLVKSGGPNFADPVTRFAYVFRYVPSHAHWLHELLGLSREAKALFESAKLRITCLGGGPGSDLVGILKYMSVNGKSPSLFCEIVDGCIEWKQTWSDLAFTLNWDSAVHTDYVIHDAADPKTWSAPNGFAKADMFTVNFFASEILHLGSTATDYLRHALRQAKPGSLVLVNDNKDPRFYNWFDQITESLGFETLLAQQGERKIYDTGERISAVGHYAQKFHGQSKLTGQLFWRVLRRP